MLCAADGLQLSTVRWLLEYGGANIEEATAVGTTAWGFLEDLFGPDSEPDEVCLCVCMCVYV
jgi:hypothetical protein